MTFRNLIALLILFNFGIVSSSSAQSPTVDVPPIGRIVFFQSGVAQIFHQGEISGNVRLKLTLPESEIEDALKSLVVEDKQGTVGGVNYQVAPSPQDTAAANFPPMSLAQILQRQRGQKISFFTGGKTVDGKIIGVEKRILSGKASEMLVVLNENGLMSYTLNEIGQVKFFDEALKTEIENALLGLAKQNGKSSSSLYINCNGKGHRTIRLSYLVNAPVWLTTYRINFKDNQAAFQAWAHVDNVTLNDWQDVQIELRSGKPHTFHVDLMSPIMIHRAVLFNDVFGIADTARVYNPFDDLAVQASRFGIGAGGGIGGGFGGGGLGGGGAIDGGLETDDRASATSLDIASSFRATSATGKSLQSVNFKIKEPITIAAGQSSAIPIFSQDLPGELLSQFDSTQSDANAAHVLSVTNETDFPLLPGPASVFVTGEFVGETTIPRIALNKKQAMIYGTDQSVTVSRNQGNAEPSDTSVKLSPAKKEVTIQTSVRTPMTFQIHNRADQVRKVVIRIPFDPNDDSRSLDPSPVRFDRQMAIYEVDVAAMQIAKLEIGWRKQLKKTTSINAAASNRERFENWKRTGVISASDYQIFDALNARHKQIAETSTQRLTIASQKKSLIDTQKRILTIIEAIGAESSEGKNYVKKLTDLESKIAKTNQTLQDISEKLNALREVD